MAEALFVPDGELFVPTDRARGPWDEHALHGGPVAALVARAAEHAVAAGAAGAAGAGPSLVLVRLTVELLRPVPTAPLKVSTTVVRPGRKVRQLAVSVHAGDVEVTRALALFMRTQPVDLPASTEPDAPPPGPDDGRPMVDEGWWEGFHNTGVEMRFVKGYFSDAGPATVWIRLAQPVVTGEEPSGAVRAAAAADFGNGVSSVLPFQGFLFINPDLTMVLDRTPVGQWICLDAVTHVTGGGIGMAESALYDSEGRMGRALQTLVVDRR
ncbi:MAG TPA: thioesterase family protein [Acidimicrobiales bacterium]|nr:thioesterase family protein [Acidimicrobiales bacterium]